MKTQSELIQKGLLASLLATSLLLSVGCAKKGDGFSATQNPDNTPAVTTPDTPRDTDGPRGPEFANGATAALQVDSIAIMTEYVATHPLNNPQDTRISVKLFEAGGAGTNQYAGDVYISYHDNGQYYTGHFNTKDAQNPSGSPAQSGTLFPNYRHSYYNNWFTDPGTATRTPVSRPVFHGFFEDQWGAILIVIDDALDLNDGSGATEVSGSIWFKNHANTQFQPNTQGIPCWFITAGPYDCRTFLTPGGSMVTASALYPPESLSRTTRSSHPYHSEDAARGWKKLGTFSGLNKAKAFSQ